MIECPCICGGAKNFFEVIWEKSDDENPTKIGEDHHDGGKPKRKVGSKCNEVGKARLGRIWNMVAAIDQINFSLIYQRMLAWFIAVPDPENDCAYHSDQTVNDKGLAPSI